MRNAISLRAVSRHRLGEMLRFSLPLLPAAASVWLMNSASTYFLSAYCKRDEVGLYQVGSTIASILALFTMAFTQAWGSFALSMAEKPFAKQLYALVGELFTVLGLFGALMVSAFAPLLLALFTTHAYAASRNVVGILAMNAIILGVPQVISIGFALTKQNGPYAKAVGLGAAVTVPLFLLLIPRFGKEGAALAVLAGNGLVPVYILWVSQRIYPLPYALKRMGLSSALILCAIAADMAMDNAKGSQAYDAFTWGRKVVVTLGLFVALAVVYVRQLPKAFGKQAEFA
jgi:O-antigen/teichoic acid export membrane protein